MIMMTCLTFPLENLISVSGTRTDGVRSQMHKNQESETSLRGNLLNAVFVFLRLCNVQTKLNVGDAVTIGNQSTTRRLCDDEKVFATTDLRGYRVWKRSSAKGKILFVKKSSTKSSHRCKKKLKYKEERCISMARE